MDVDDEEEVRPKEVDDFSIEVDFSGLEDEDREVRKYR